MPGRGPGPAGGVEGHNTGETQGSAVSPWQGAVLPYVPPPWLCKWSLARSRSCHREVVTWQITCLSCLSW
eukprot:10834303-Alexandrium_andersonii.AAC.1